MDSKYRFNWSKISKELLILARRFKCLPRRLIEKLEIAFVARKCWVVAYRDSMDDAYGNSLDFIQDEFYLYKKNAKRRIKRLESYNEYCWIYPTWIEHDRIKEGKIWFEDWIKKA